jgi:hypothetical protein
MSLTAFLTFLGIGATTAATIATVVSWTVTLATLAVGVKGYRQAKDMQAQGQVIMANKTSAGGKLPVIYGTRRVGAQIIYMDVSANDSRDLYVVYALSVGECDEIIGRTIELDGNPLTDSARFRDGGYIGSDKISSGSGSLNTVSQNGTGIDAGAGQFGTSPTQKYRYVMNLHHGAVTQTADPMLVASMPNWTSAHKLNGVCYIAAHYGYDKEGIWSGVPQLTVQVRGKKVFDPRDTNQTFGTVSTYEYSDNPALTFLDYITNNDYGKGLTQSQINMSTFTAAANVCDTEVDQPYFNGSAQSLTWSGNVGDDFITIGGTDPDSAWWQNKVGEVIDIRDGSNTLIVDGKEIKDVQRNGFYDQNNEYIVYINDTLGSTYSSQAGTSLVKVKRFHCNGYLDANKNVMDNAKELLANMRGIFLYIDGKYELSIEDTGTSTFSINDNHIIADAGISVDYGNKDKKANKVIVEFFNANKKYELDTATVLHDASPEYYSDDGDEILEIKAEFPYISDPYIAYNMGKAILTRSRNQTTMQFLGTPEMYKLNVGDIVDLTYAGLGFSGKVCRVEALELQPNGLVAVSLIEYFDVYTWEVPPQEPVEELANLPSAYAVKAPTGLSFTDTDSSSTGRPFLSWNEPTDFPNYQYRINVVDSSSNQVINKIVDVENCDLNFLPVDTNYVASVSSLNTLGSESSPATLTFTIGDAPTATADIQDDAVTLDKIGADVQSAINAGGTNSTQLIKSTSAPTTRSDSSALQPQDLWADTDDNNQMYVRNASNNGWVKARDSSLITLYNSLSSTVSTNTTNIATAQGDIVTLTTDTSANASAITSLTSTVNSNTSAISTEQTTRANADTALAADITSLTSTVNNNTSAITSEATTRANADTALASDITSLTSIVDDNTADITSEATTRANADTALASDITSLTSTVNSNTSAITSEATTRANADTALASDITSLTSTVNSNTSAITSEATTRANADTALASDITSLTSTVGGNTASITTNATAITDINDNASASYVLQLNANGKVAQMVLESNADSGTGATSTIAFLADTFKIDNDAGSSISPFVVSGGTVLIDNARINNLSADKILIDGVTLDTDGSGNLIIKSGGVDTNQIASNAVTNDKVQSISATKITADQLDAARINVDTLNVKHFADVSADIISHTGSAVPLSTFASAFQRGSTNFTTITSTTGTYLSSCVVDDVRDGASYQAIWTGVYGDCTNGVLEYSVNGGSTYTQAAGGIQNVTMAAGTFRTYVFAYNGTISGLPTSGTNANKVYWRVRWITKLRSTYQSLYVFIDNTQ